MFENTTEQITDKEVEKAFQYVVKHGEFPKDVSMAMLFRLKERMKKQDSPYSMAITIEKGEK